MTNNFASIGNVEFSSDEIFPNITVTKSNSVDSHISFNEIEPISVNHTISLWYRCAGFKNVKMIWGTMTQPYLNLFGEIGYISLNTGDSAAGFLASDDFRNTEWRLFTMNFNGGTIVTGKQVS